METDNLFYSVNEEGAITGPGQGVREITEWLIIFIMEYFLMFRM